MYIELGKYWEIRFTRDFVNDYLDKVIPKPNPTKLDGALVANKRILFTKHIKDVGIIPRWYGFAYHDFNTDTIAYMPVPVNLIYAVLRWVKWNVLRKIKIDWPRWLMLWEKRIYRLGQIDGYDAGRFTRDMSEGDDDPHRILEGVNPKTNPGWNKIYKDGE